MPDLIQGVDLGALRLDLLGRLLLAAALGGLVGIEREWSGKPAGFRTNLLICVGAALLTDLSMAVAAAAEPGAAADPGRIAAQIVSGIGFLGAGTIIQMRGGVVGLTTAATLWVVAAIGIAVGARAYVEAVGTTVLVLVSLLALARLEPYLSRTAEGVVRVTMTRDADLVERVEAVMAEGMARTRVVEAERSADSVTMAYEIAGPRNVVSGLVRRLLDIEGVRKVARR